MGGRLRHRRRAHGIVLAADIRGDSIVGRPGVLWMEAKQMGGCRRRRTRRRCRMLGLHRPGGESTGRGGPRDQPRWTSVVE